MPRRKNLVRKPYDIPIRCRVADAYVQALGLKAAAHISEYVLTSRHTCLSARPVGDGKWISKTTPQIGALCRRAIRCRRAIGKALARPVARKRSMRPNGVM